MRSEKNAAKTMEARSEVAQIMYALRQVLDPELGVNIVDLGLVYDVGIRDSRVHVAMTMTSPACPMGELLAGQVEAEIGRRLPTVRSVEVEWVWDPPWRPERMSDVARLQLGWKSPHT